MFTVLCRLLCPQKFAWTALKSGVPLDFVSLPWKSWILLLLESVRPLPMPVCEGISSESYQATLKRG